MGCAVAGAGPVREGHTADLAEQVGVVGDMIGDDVDAGDVELVQRRWSWPGPTGKPVYNFRSEARSFGSNRCLILADGFYEFTDKPSEEGAPKRRSKDKWLFTTKIAASLPSRASIGPSLRSARHSRCWRQSQGRTWCHTMIGR